jgi:hypothetical protein
MDELVAGERQRGLQMALNRAVWRERSPDLSWAAFAARHPQLLARERSVLARHCTNAVLKSERAACMFGLPDRGVVAADRCRSVSAARDGAQRRRRSLAARDAGVG